MKLPGASLPVPDLTRWNRSGLSRFRYVDGAAAEWLEELRLYHLLLYAQGTPKDWDPAVWREAFRKGTFDDMPPTPVGKAVKDLNPAWQRGAPDGHYPPDATYRQMLRAQYDFRALDQTRQISRAFARALHILTESLDAYANEGLLGTATQPEHLRRLLDMIGYCPRAATSAVTPVALILKADAGRQSLPAGLAFDHNPGDGGDVLDFESLVAADAHPALNMLRPLGWDTTDQLIPLTRTSFMLAEPGLLDSGLVGSHALLGAGSSWEAVTVAAIDKASASLTLRRGQAMPAPWKTAELRTAPAVTLALRPQGSNWLHFDAPPRVSVGQQLALEFASPDSGSAQIVARYDHQPFIVTVSEVRGRDVRVNKSVLGPVDAVYQARHLIIDTGRTIDKLAVLEVGPLVAAPEFGAVGTLDAGFAAGRCNALGRCPPEIADDADLVCVLSDGAIRSARVEAGSVKDTGDDFTFKVAGAGVSMTDIVAVEAGFRRDSALVTSLRSEVPLFNAQGRVTLQTSEDLSGMLFAGRHVLIAPAPELKQKGLSMQLTVKDVEAKAGSLALRFEEDTRSLAALTAGDAVVYGNVVLFGHGKTSAPKAIGSGDSSADRQTFTLDDQALSTRPDPAFSGGAGLDIEIRVGDRSWRQVARFADASPDEPVYFMTVGADGRYRLTFSQRLPTGKDNVVMTRRRLGAGGRGNLLKAWQVSGLKPKHAAIDAIVQPLGAGTGADMETAEDLRRQGTAYFTLADRAVAVGDYAALAERHAGVWHAAAQLERSIAVNSVMRVAVTVVPAGNITVDAIRQDLTAFLAARSSAGVSIDIRSFLPAPFGGHARIRLKPGYARSQSIMDEIRAVLMARFGLAARRLGQPLYVTEIVAAMEEMEEVENLTFTLDPRWGGVAPETVTSAAGAIQAVMPRFGQDVYIADGNDIQLELMTGGT